MHLAAHDLFIGGTGFRFQRELCFIVQTDSRLKLVVEGRSRNEFGGTGLFLRWQVCALG
jgi:hypothetical protein